MNDAPQTLTDEYRVRAYEVGPDRKVTPASLADYLQETAGHHADALGLGPERLMPEGVFWVLSRLRMKIHRRPESQEELSLTTWPSALDRHVAYRDFKMHAGGELLLEATSAWLVFDLEERKMIAVPEWIRGALPELPARNLEFETRTLPRLSEAVHEQPLRARRADLDMLGHVNNVRFLEWALEALPDVWVESKRLTDLDIQFRQECRSGDEVVSRAADVADAPGRIRHAIVRPADGAELVRAHTQWEDA
jgi:acyl-ACP thioesterase